MKPFYQGMLDTFCAIYAVLNALRLTHGIRVDKGRKLLNETIMDLAREPKLLQAVLEQTTDYVFIVDALLKKSASRMPLRVEVPYSGDDQPTVEDFWQTCFEWINAGKNRTAILRFFRYLKADQPPMVRHWTTIESIGESSLHLYDSSHEAEAIMHLHKDTIVLSPEEISERVLLYVQPTSLRLIRLPV